MNYTKGEWNCKPCLLGSPDNAINIVVRSSTGTPVARIFSKDATLFGMTSLAPSRQEALANAQLISASPQMYRALIEVWNKLNGIFITDGSSRRERDEAVAIIKKIIAEVEGR